MLSSVYLVEYTLHQNLMIEIYTRNFDLHITVPSPNLAFLCRNLDYKPYSINQSIYHETLIYPFCYHETLIYPSRYHETLIYPSRYHETLIYPSRYHETLIYPSRYHETLIYPSRYHETLIYFSLHFLFSLHTVYKKMSDAMTKHPDADVLVSFASLRSAYESTIEALSYPQVC